MPVHGKTNFYKGNKPNAKYIRENARSFDSTFAKLDGIPFTRSSTKPFQNACNNLV